MKNNESVEKMLEEVSELDKSKYKFDKKPLGMIKITKSEIDLMKNNELKEEKERIKKQKEQDRILEKEKENKKKNSFINKFKNKLTLFLKKLKDKFKKLVDNEDITFLNEFFPSIIINGIFINFSLFCIFGIKFSWFSFLGWGIALWYIEKNLLTLIKSIKKKEI